MSVAVLAPPAIETIADLIESLGDVPPDRIRLIPAPGTATEADVLAAHARDKRLFELVDGVLVEKGMGYHESSLAYVLGGLIFEFLRKHNLGKGAGEAGMLRMAPGLVRIPDFSFIRWERFPQQFEGMAPIAPDLAIEVLSPSNTRREMARKLREYFEFGASLVWFVDPKTRTVAVYTSPEDVTVLDQHQTLTGGQVLPGLEISLKEVFDWAEQRGPKA